MISRSKGRSATASAAYRAGARIDDLQTGEVHDYRRKSGVRESEIIVPDQAPAWMTNRSKLWNAVESAERRKDAQVAREIELALPKELDARRQAELIHGWISREVTPFGIVADVSIHDAVSGNGEPQPHAHVMMTTRHIDESSSGFGRKAREWDDRGMLAHWRESWSAHVNDALKRTGHRGVGVDHRTLAAQRMSARSRGDTKRVRDLSREPEPKVGPSAMAMERRGLATERGGLRRQVHEGNERIVGIMHSLQRLAGHVREIRRHVSSSEKTSESTEHARGHGDDGARTGNGDDEVEAAVRAEFERPKPPGRRRDRRRRQRER